MGDEAEEQTGCQAGYERRGMVGSRSRAHRCLTISADSRKLDDMARRLDDMGRRIEFMAEICDNALDKKLSLEEHHKKYQEICNKYTDLTGRPIEE